MDYKVLYEKKEYNLNAVLSFDLLKEVLYKLLISQGNLEKEIDNIKKSNTKRDNDISKLQKAIKDNVAYDEDYSGDLNNSYFSQQENEEEEENENNPENEEEENIPINNDQKEEETKEEEKVVNNEKEEEKNDDNEIKVVKEVKEIKEIKPQVEIIKGEEIKFNGENKETEIKEIKNEKEKEVIEKDNKEVNNENKQDEKKEEKENIIEEPKEEKKEEIKEEKHEEVKNEEKDNKINTENIKEPKKEEIKKIEAKKPEAKSNKGENKVHISKKPKKLIQKEEIDVTSDQNNNNNTIQSNNNQIPTELISKMAKQIKDNKRQILDLEKRFKKELVLKTENVKNESKQMISKSNKDNQLKFNELDDKFNQMMELKEKLENQMEDCVTKCSTIDVFNMFKDSGDGTVDAAKVMVRALEEKIFKKIEYIDTRAKNDQSNSSEIKNKMSNFTEIIDNMDRNIKYHTEYINKNKDDMNKLKNDFDEYKMNVDELMQNNPGMKKDIERLKNQGNNIKNKLNEIQEKIKDLKNVGGNEESENDEIKADKKNKTIDEDIIQTLEKRIGDLRKKMNDLDNTLKLKIQDLAEIQVETKNMKSVLDKKITRDDLKELYNLRLNDLDEVNDIKDNIQLTFDDIRKLKEAQTNIFQKLENITRNISLLQSIKKNGTVTPSLINFDKYVEIQKLNEIIKPIQSSIQEINKELASLDRNLSETNSYTKTLVKTDRVNKLEDDLNAKISELKVIFSKKFVDKAELAKNVKQLELQIKTLDFENRKSDADTWLMAKQPVGCFNCASCEANIKNVNPSGEYLPWNKYPQQDKIYRMGKGFSHMLQMMTSEFVKSIGNAQKENEVDSTPRNNGINPSFVLDKNTFNKNDNINNNQGERKQSASVLKINNKEQFNDLKKVNIYNLYSSKGKKLQLPRVLKFKKKLKLRNGNGVPVSDDELSRRNDSVEKDHFIDQTSPKIMKITKKKQYLKTEDNGELNVTDNGKF